MYCSSTTNNRIDQLHERSLRIVYNDYGLSFDELLEKDGLFNVDHYSIQTLAIEMFKVYSNLSETIRSELSRLSVTTKALQ